MSYWLNFLLIALAWDSCSSGNIFPSNTIGKGPGEAFVHLFEWSWDDIAKECEKVLAPKGYSAVQISPPSEHKQGDSWNVRYQPVSYNLVSRSGNEAQLRSMVQRCAAVGVDIYADIVPNQMAGPWGGTGNNGTVYGDRTYGSLYTPDDFHHPPGDTSTNCGVDDYMDAHNVQACDLMGMPDLCTGCEKVQKKIADYINRLYKIGIKGIRIDAAKHQNAAELSRILDRISPEVYRFLEVLTTADEAVQPPEYYSLGQITNFPFAYNLGPKFVSGGQLQTDLASFGEPWGMMSSAQSVVFTDNQDSQRDAAPLTFQREPVQYVLANVFMLAWPYGYPKVMSSYYFSDVDQGRPGVPVYGKHGESNCNDGINWVCEHRWTAIANMVRWRKCAGDLPVTHFTVSNDGPTNGQVLWFCRGGDDGDRACVAFNKQTEPWTTTLQTNMPEGSYCDVSESDMDDCPLVHVGKDGSANVVVPGMSAVAFHVDKHPSSAATSLSSLSPRPQLTALTHLQKLRSNAGMTQVAFSIALIVCIVTWAGLFAVLLRRQRLSITSDVGTASQALLMA